MPRSTKTLFDQPTKQFFVPATGGTEASRSGAYTGYLINDQGDDAWVVFMVPHDFGRIVYCELVVIGIAADASMTVNIDSAYANPDESNTQQTQGAFQFTLTNVGAAQLKTVDIINLVNGDATVSRVKPLDYVAVHAEHLTDTNLLVLGVMFGYR